MTTTISFCYSFVTDLLTQEDFERRVKELIEVGAGWLTEPTASMLLVMDLGRNRARLDAVPQHIARIRSELAQDSILQRTVMLRDHLTCRYCKRVGARRDPDGQPWHIDHMLPVSKGGDNQLMNLALSCEKCNLKKGTSEASRSLYQEGDTEGEWRATVALGSGHSLMFDLTLLEGDGLGDKYEKLPLVTPIQEVRLRNQRELLKGAP